ncbi:MAG: hypothetical protein U0586_03115 [Candidatus Brocadiaceae bacterium]
MELIIDFIEDLIYIYEEVFWLKECFMTLKSIFIFLLVRWIMKLEYKVTLLLYLASFIGIACIFFGDIGYLSDNDVLKLIGPTTLFLLLAYNKNKESDYIVFIFLIPYLITSYEFYRSLPLVIESLISHALIIVSIVVVKENLYLSLFMSAVIGILINLIGYNTAPGTNDILVNPALITLATKGLERYTKDKKYSEFLKSFWITLVCFAYFGSWIFHSIKPGCPLYHTTEIYKSHSKHPSMPSNPPPLFD